MRPMAWQVRRLVEIAMAGLPVFVAAQEAMIEYRAALDLCRAAKVRVKRGRRKGSRFPIVDPIRKARALTLISEGATLREAGAAVGVSHETVNLWRQQEGVPLRRARKRRAGASPGAPWAISKKKPETAPKPEKAEPIDPRIIKSSRGISLARRA
ncbi:hypothetical protein AMST5_04096 [freshwater sediment metagenome]|uniref:Uncharacterized protein n=1 Tax=freshwater sediment metagenome TaxID=556182 RepID=A0AA48RFA7_9ZZZZ